MKEIELIILPPKDNESKNEVDVFAKLIYLLTSGLSGLS